MDDAVFEAQSYLRNIGRLDSDISRVVPDGIFGAETVAAVQSFQKKHGLPHYFSISVTQSFENRKIFDKKFKNFFKGQKLTG